MTERNNRIRWPGVAAATLALLMLPQIVEAVLVAPHAVFMDRTHRTAQLTLLNTGTDPEEVSIDLQFGYPDTDSAGNVFVRLVEEPEPNHPSAAGWVRAFPRRLRLPPGARQVVRLLATPPADISDGEYWSRILVTSRGGKVAVAGGDDRVSAGVTLELRTIISLAYRNGQVHTGVELTDLTMDVQEDSLIAWVGLERQGNAAYLGQLTFDIRNAADSSVATYPTPIAVYYSLRRRFAFPLEEMPAGSYTVHFQLNTDRKDLEASDVLRADPIVRSMGVEVSTR